MPRWILPAVALPLACLAGCSSSSSARDRQRAQINAMNEITDLLATVHDEATAQAAKPKLIAAAERLKQLQTEYKQFVTEELKKGKQLKFQEPDKNATDMMAAMQRYSAEMQRLQTVPGGIDLMKEFLPKLGPTGFK
jgi:outer membrane murein-binding lipoprotein Lpp